MDRRNIYIVVAVIVVLAVLGYALGWFGGDAPETATPAPTTTPAPATTTPAPATTTPAPAAPATGTTNQ
jgi:hypothetical protein